MANGPAFGMPNRMWLKSLKPFHLDWDRLVFAMLLLQAFMRSFANTTAKQAVCSKRTLGITVLLGTFHPSDLTGIIQTAKEKIH